MHPFFLNGHINKKKSPMSDRNHMDSGRKPTEDRELEQLFRTAKQQILAGGRTHPEVASQLRAAVDVYENLYGRERARKIVELFYDCQNFIDSRLIRDTRARLRPMSGMESDQLDHWSNELDEVARHVGLDTKPMMRESSDPNRSHRLLSAPILSDNAGEIDWQLRQWENSLRQDPDFRPTHKELYRLAQEFDEKFPDQDIPPSWFAKFAGDIDPIKKKARPWLETLSLLVKEARDCSRIADSTDIYTTFKRMRKADANEEQELRDAVISALNQEGFLYVHSLLTQMHQCYRVNEYAKRLFGQMIDLAERAHLTLVTDDLNAWIRAKDIVPHSEKVIEQLEELSGVFAAVNKNTSLLRPDPSFIVDWPQKRWPGLS
jgi:hypothetical protein